ncbi:MAG: hypothetical protein HY735_21980 [Verrucomicrobia bacterium]|nr:hypothetical protein [Verrucomicrobiota bacterium]
MPHLTFPIGQSGSTQKRSELMARYRTGGTPWVVIVDRNGVVRFNDFHLEAREATKLIEQLKKTSEPTE